jgi:hypothetical protein
MRYSLHALQKREDSTEYCLFGNDPAVIIVCPETELTPSLCNAPVSSQKNRPGTYVPLVGFSINLAYFTGLIGFVTRPFTCMLAALLGRNDA